ncbi:MAG: hypothetical protein KJZ68_15865, partial [Phycisphaerales bacterium]|nr:hypothetical protein [Phycisphaerales bacterium]
MATRKNTSASRTPPSAKGGVKRAGLRQSGRAGGEGGASGGGASGGGASGGGASGGGQLVIVESPAKAKTINKYLGPGFTVRASVGHIRDLPSKNPKGVKQPVPGVDLEHKFQPTYEILPGKKKTVTELKQLARKASEVWFAT